VPGLKAQEVAERQKQDADANSYFKASARLVDEVQELGENTKTLELTGDEVQHADDWDGWMEECRLNPNSLIELEGALVERHLALSVSSSSSSSAPDGFFDTVQFVRQGYFVLDRPVLGCEDSRERERELQEVVFNEVVPLKGVLAV
jgi:hypothetical protein